MYQIEAANDAGSVATAWTIGRTREGGNSIHFCASLALSCLIFCKCKVLNVNFSSCCQLCMLYTLMFDI